MSATSDERSEEYSTLYGMKNGAVIQCPDCEAVAMGVRHKNGCRRTNTVTVDREKLRAALVVTAWGIAPGDEDKRACRWPECEFYKEKNIYRNSEPHSGDCPLAEEE